MSGKSADTIAKSFPGQHDGEVVHMLFRQHPLVMRKALIVGLLVILFAVLPLAFEQVWAFEQVAAFLVKVATWAPVVVLAAWFYRWIGWYYTMYIVTDQRILAVKQKGLFDRQVDEWQLEGINNLNYHIGGFQAVLFGYGDITARTYLGDFEMKTIHKPAEIHDQLMQAVRRSGGAGGSTPRPN